jgi:hypothetical protein
MSLSPPSRFQGHDWLFRFVFGFGVVVALATFVWFISRNQPPPLPGRFEVKMTEEVKALAETAQIASPLTSCHYSSKNFAFYSCALPVGAAAALGDALRKQGWQSSTEDRNSGTMEYARGRDRFAIYCQPQKSECKFDFTREWQ